MSENTEGTQEAVSEEAVTQETVTEAADTPNNDTTTTEQEVDALDRSITDEQNIVARLFAKASEDISEEEEVETQEEEVVEEESEEEVTEEEVTQSPSITLIARKEKGLKKREDALKTKAGQLETTLSNLETAGIRFNEDGQLDMDFLEGKVTAVEEPETKESSLEKRLAALEAEKVESEKKTNQTQQEALVSDFRNEINTFIDNSDKYDIIKLTAGTPLDGREQVFSLITEYAQETGELLSVEKACELVEKELEPTIARFRTTEKKEEVKKIVKKPISTVLPSKAGIVSSPATDKTDKDRMNNAMTLLRELKK